MYRIAVDVMSGDEGLSVTIPACQSFLKQNQDVYLILVGDQVQIESMLTQYPISKDRFRIQHASEIVHMGESPQSALKNKKDSSIRVAVNLVKESAADAVVSAGNTGALMATARFVLKTIPGISRPAIAKFLPNQENRKTLVLDLGANVDCSSECLLQFALLGSELVTALQPDCVHPKVGLLNVGTEQIKGSQSVKNTFPLLESSQLNFIGNVEGNAIFDGSVDVVVCDGFTGNAVLKSVEGIVHLMSGVVKTEVKNSLLAKCALLLAMPTLRRVKERFNPKAYNGAIFLGLKGIVIKSHGGADSVGFESALHEAYLEMTSQSLQKMEQGIAEKLAFLSEECVL